ncbi:MAG: hypothetical protein H5U40_19405, partial [Polyangiaceae bacterium]|nr:hypothetical protein [Polyangiaceae bacterium]
MSETLENKPPRDVTLARLFGLVFALFVVFHVVETSTVVFGRDAFLGRLAAVIPPWARLIVLAPLAFHARLLFSLVGGTGRYVDAGVRKLQRLSALAVLAFLVLHLGHALVPALTLPPAAAYEMLRHELSMPIYFAIYVVGITATCL